MSTAKNTTGNIRKMLIQALEQASTGKLSADDGKNMIGLANQISHSMQTEVKAQAMALKLGHNVEKFGSLKVD
jgi:hypothetical protein